MIDLRHPLAVLATRMPWAEIGADAVLCPSGSQGTSDQKSLDLFGPTLQVAGAGTSPAGRRRLPIRLMVRLLLPQARLRRERRERRATLGREPLLGAPGDRQGTGVVTVPLR